MEKTLSRKSAGTFGIDLIECFDWSLGFGVATIHASNLVGDSIQFTLYRHPQGFAVSNIEEVDLASSDIPPYKVQEIVNEKIAPLAQIELDEWWNEILRLRNLFSYKTFQISAGITPDDSFHALVAYLYGVRQVFSNRKVVESMAEDMNIKPDASRERIRRARNKGFLTSPGRGKVGKGRITKTGIAALEDAGLINNKRLAIRKEWV